MYVLSSEGETLHFAMSRAYVVKFCRKRDPKGSGSSTLTISNGRAASTVKYRKVLGRWKTEDESAG